MSGIIEFINITKFFRNKSGQNINILDGFSHKVETGINCLLGTTGCGKTTLLRLAAGIIKPDNGMVAVGNQKSSMDSAGYISQHNTLLPWKNLLENTSLPQQINHISRKQRHAAAMEVLNKVGLSANAKMYPHECSGGMKQRAMLARQLLHPSRYWLMDEPFSSLDLPTRRGLQELIKDLQKELQLTILMVTHDIDEALNTASNIALMPIDGKNQPLKIDISCDQQQMRRQIESIFLQQSAENQS